MSRKFNTKRFILLSFALIACMTISAQTQTICLKCFGKGYNIVGTGNSSHPTKEVKCAQCNGYGTSDGRPKQERIYGSFDDEMAV